LLVFFVAGWLVAQTSGSPRVPADASTNERLAKVEATLAVLQVQVADIQKTQVDMQKQLSDLNAKVSLVPWVGAAVGVLLLGAAWKSLERKEGVAKFGQWEMDALARRVARRASA
jgi:hypothetical protein